MVIFSLIKKIKESMEPKTMVTVKKFKIKKTKRKKTKLKTKSFKLYPKKSRPKSKPKPKLKIKSKVKAKSKLRLRPKKSRKKLKKKPSRKKPTKIKKPIPIIFEAPIGEVTHFFPQISVCVLTITSGNLKVADTIRIVGSSTNFKQRIKSMQINHLPIQSAVRGDDVGLKVNRRVRINDKVYKLN